MIRRDNGIFAKKRSVQNSDGRKERRRKKKKRRILFFLMGEKFFFFKSIRRNSERVSPRLIFLLGGKGGNENSPTRFDVEKGKRVVAYVRYLMVADRE